LGTGQTDLALEKLLIFVASTRPQTKVFGLVFLIHFIFGLLKSFNSSFCFLKGKKLKER